MARVVADSFSAYESITVAGTAVGLTAASISGKSIAHITCEGAQIRYRLDSVAPTATEGHILEAGEGLELVGINQLSNFKAVRSGNTSATIKASYGV